MARNYKRDYEELPKFAQKYIGEPSANCIEAYAKKRGIVLHRAGKAFWNLVDDGIIKVKYEYDERINCDNAYIV